MTPGTHCRNRRILMVDAIFVAATLGFFALGALFVQACDRI